MIKYIESKQNEKIKELVRLKNKSYRNETKKFLVEGFHLFEMARETNCLSEVYCLKEIPELNVDQYIITEEILKKISSTKSPQGIVCACNQLVPSKIFGEKILYLDGIQDPGNLGTILRTGLAFGYKDIILSTNCVSVYNEKVISSSQGAIFKLNVINSMNINDLSGYQIIVSTLDDATDFDCFVPKKKHILVLGNEAHGVSKEIMNLASAKVKISISEIDSLNVAIAGAIMMQKFSKNNN